MCKHHKNKCKIFAKCCNKYYDCPKCHNKNETHILDINTIDKLKCSNCNCDNNLNENPTNCYNCNIKFASYYCLECKIWCNRNNVFHCYKCKACKLGEKGQSYHCDNCNLCLSLKTKDTHKCSNKNIDRNKVCPICLDNINNIKDTILLLKCDHLIHKKCFDELVSNTKYNKIPCCTLCKKSIFNPYKYKEKFDNLINEEVMPQYYENWKSNILCNDCNSKNDVKFHTNFHKCTSCNSYNTSILNIIKH